MTRKIVSARRRIEQRDKPGDAAKFIKHALTDLPAGTKTVLCARVSERDQGHRGNLDDQVKNMQRALSQRGIVVLETFENVGPGWDPWWLAGCGLCGEA